ncbi:hypothetical protein BJX70DRAFT_318880 [Aspergillus crustosus]
MISLKTSLVGALLVGTFPGTMARECLASDILPEVDQTVTISSPNQLSGFDGCTTIIGNLQIDSAYRGGFTLSGVTAIAGQLIMDESNESHDLEAIELPDLIHIDSLSLPQAWGMKTLSAPRLESVDTLTFIQAFEEDSFDFTGLTSASTVLIAGAWTNITFPSLKTVARELTIVTDPTWAVDHRPNPLEINLPSLVRAQWMGIRGYVKRLRLPNLVALGAETGETGEPRGMAVYANYTDLAGVTLPNLKELNGELLINGHVSSVHLGGMRETNATITIRAESRMEIYGELQSAGAINLSGQLANIYLVALSRAEAININSASGPGCASSLIETYEDLYGPDKPFACSSNHRTDDYNNPYPASYSPTPTPSWTLTPTPTPTPRPAPVLSATEKAAVISVCVVVGIFVLVGGFLWRVTQKAKKMKESARTPVVSAAAAAVAAHPHPRSPSGGGRTVVVRSQPRGDDEHAEPPPPYSGELPPYYQEVRK